MNWAWYQRCNHYSGILSRKSRMSYVSNLMAWSSRKILILTLRFGVASPFAVRWNSRILFMHARTQCLPFFLWFHDLLTFIRVNYLEIKKRYSKRWKYYYDLHENIWLLVKSTAVKIYFFYFGMLIWTITLFFSASSTI